VSYDLLLFTRERPDGEALATLAGVGAVDEPVDVEAEDLPDAVAGAIVAPRSLVEVHLEGAPGKSAVSAARKAVRDVAEQLRGAAYDPQEDELVWPRKAQRVPAVDRSAGRIRTVRLQWAFARRLGAGDAQALLAVLRRALPEALPARFGDFEPFQGRLDRDGDDAFAALWEQGSLFWKGGGWPSAGGSATIWRDVMKRPDDPADLAFVDHLDLDFDARAPDGDPAWADALADLLVLVADRLEPFYAAGVVERGAIAAKNGSVSYDRESERRVPVGRFWLGLPDFDPWLAWYGGELAELTRTAGLVRLADHPVDSDAAAGLAPDLPPDLRRGGDQLDSARRAARLPSIVLD
jgi:hypothetical protein